MKEIWFINQYAVTPDLPGGTRHYDFAVELVKSGLAVRIFASNVNLATRKYERDLADRLWLEQPVEGIFFEWVKTSLHRRNDWRRVLGMFNFSWNVYRAGLKQGVAPDVIIGSSPHPFAALAGCYLARRLGCRFILEVRDLWPQALIDMRGLADKHPLVWLMRRVEQQLYLHADQVIVLARGSIPYLKEKGVAEQRITHIPNGVYPGHCAPRTTREQTRNLFNFNRFTIVYTGAHGPANALNVIMEAAGELNGEPDCEFILIGDGPVKPDLQAQARKLELKNLRFLDPVPKSKIPDLLHAADAGIITLKDAPAFYEAVSPNKLFDYLAAGLPVLCTAPGDVAQMVKRYGCGLISPPENGKALAEQVRTLAALTAEQRALMSARERRLALEHFSIPKLALKLLQIINDNNQ